MGIHRSRHAAPNPGRHLSPALSLDFDLLDFDYFEFPEFKEKLKSRLGDVKSLVSSLDFDSPLSYVPTLSAVCMPTSPPNSPASIAVAAVPSLPASISLPSLPRASLSAVSLLDHGFLGHSYAHGHEHGHAEGEVAEESGPTPADALRRADFGRKLIGYEDLPLEWRNNPWVVEGYRAACAASAPRLLEAESRRGPLSQPGDMLTSALHPRRAMRACLMSAVGHVVLVRLSSPFLFPSLWRRGDRELSTVDSGRAASSSCRAGNSVLRVEPVLFSMHRTVHGGCSFIPLTRWPTLARSVFTLHNESLNIHTHFVPMVLWGAAFWGVVPGFLKPLAPWLEVPDAWARKWVGEDWARYTVFGAPNPPPPDAAESLFTLFALACSALWRTMAGCAHRGAMEACARVDYVGIGWLIATSIATVVHHGTPAPSRPSTPRLGHSILHPSTLLHSGAVEKVVEGGKWVDGVRGVGPFGHAGELHGAAAPAPGFLSSPLRPLHSRPHLAASLFTPVLDFASALTALVSATSNATSSLAAWPAYHPVGAGCLLLCAAAGVSGNVLPFCDWFNRVENRLWRLAFFVGISFSALAPLAGIAALQGWDTMIRFVAPVGPSLLYYIVGLVVYATQVPERFLGGRRGWVGWVSDMCGGGSHGIWHIFIVLAMRAHRDGIREMRRAAAEGGCAIRAGPGA
ncbi:hemolysin-III related-domain-containing protein [Mycena leptocephala]|nr:hemolysin-III related-domain-containing protein [Mycena leptocephala]